MIKNYIQLKNVSKVYKGDSFEVKALNNVSFDIDEGEFVIVLGPSGSGKTTLLNILGGMDKATDGSLIINGRDISRYNKKELTLYRRNDIGFVFQFYNLMPNLTAVENVELACELSKNALDPKRILEQVGLRDRTNSFTGQLSGGEQQRVSIARAIAKNPSLLLCDEPTGALDYMTGKNVLGLLFNISKEMHKTVIIVTHNQAIKDMANKVIMIKNGMVDRIVINSSPKDIKDIEW